MGDNQAYELLLSLLLIDALGLKTSAIKALGELGDKRAIAPLKTVLETENSQSSTVRPYVLDAIRKLSDK